MVRAGYSNPLLNILSRILPRTGPTNSWNGKIAGQTRDGRFSNALQEHPIALARSVGNAY